MPEKAQDIERFGSDPNPKTQNNENEKNSGISLSFPPQIGNGNSGVSCSVASLPLRNLLGYKSGQVTKKADVYSFGVVLMELITGRKAVGETHDEETFHLVTWFRKMLIQKDTFREAIDQSIDLNEDILAMFESIDASTHPRDDKQRISAERHCVACDIVNMIACEGAERVERHELLGKWRSRLRMAGFSQCPLSSSVTMAVSDLLKGFDGNYRIEEKDGALYLGWKSRAMATSSAWR